MVAGCWSGRKGELVSHGYGVSVWDDGKFWRWMVDNGDLYTQPYRIIYLKLVKMLHFMLRIFTTIVFKKEKNIQV